MRATFAGHTFELIGCETMHNADKWARFPCKDSRADCTVRVTVQDELLAHCTEWQTQTGDWRTQECDGRRRFHHRYRTLRIETDDRFADTHLTFSTQMPQMDTILYLQVQHMMGSYLLLHGGCLIHSAGLVLNGKGVLLCGRSGVGKSTMAKHLCRQDASVTVLSEEMPALTVGENGFTVHGTPLCGGDEQCCDAHAPLSQIVILKQARENRLIIPCAEQAVFSLLEVISRSAYEQTVATAATDTVMLLAEHMPIVVFENDGTDEAARMLRTHLQTKSRDGQ